MSKIISLVILQAIFCSTFFTLTYSVNPLVESTCKKTPFFQLCMSALANYPISDHADVAGLAIILSDSLSGQASLTLSQVSKLLKSATKPSLKKALNGCVDSYNTIIKADIPVAVEAVKKGNPKFAVDSSTDAANEAGRCAQNIGNSDYVSNEVVRRLCIILKSMASLLL